MRNLYRFRLRRNHCWLLTVDCWLMTVDCWLMTVDWWLLTVDCESKNENCANYLLAAWFDFTPDDEARIWYHSGSRPELILDGQILTKNTYLPTVRVRLTTLRRNRVLARPRLTHLKYLLWWKTRFFFRNPVSEWERARQAPSWDRCLCSSALDI